MDNLFLQAIGNDKVESINKIKRNKEFLKKLIGDLQQVYTLFVSNEDQQNGSQFAIKKSPSYINTIFFTADENSCRFRTSLLGYRKDAIPERNLGWITDKYDTCKGDDRFMADVKQPFGYIDVVINFTDVSANLMDIIKDIARILDHEQVAKRF
jgi:hypothetical protein